jgi:selenocysteine-specific translation elongation factor
MPQTREHLAICSLLHIRAGLVVLTKAISSSRTGSSW